MIAVSRGVGGAHWSLTPFYRPEAFQAGVIFSALSVAVLSFLGFDAISTLAEETKGGARRWSGGPRCSPCASPRRSSSCRPISRVLLVPGQTEFVGDTATNEAFYTVADRSADRRSSSLVAIAVALAAAIANALVAQAATARLLFAMARDGQLPRFLAHVHPTRQVPERAVLLVSAVSMVLGLFFVGQLGLLSSLVNFGALFSFLMLHISVVVYFMLKRRARNVRHCTCCRPCSGSSSSRSCWSMPTRAQRSAAWCGWRSASSS